MGWGMFEGNEKRKLGPTFGMLYPKRRAENPTAPVAANLWDTITFYGKDLRCHNI